MKKKIVLWAGTVIIIALLSLLLSGIVQNLLINPFLRIIWVIKGYYGSIHQGIIWGFIIFCVLIIAIFNMSGFNLTIFPSKVKHPRIPGDVNQMAFWIRNARRAPYPRWYLARTCADLALDLVRSRGENVDRASEIRGPGWTPPANVQEYLDIALHSTPGTFSRLIETNYIGDDPDPRTIIAYFESYMEDFND